MISTAAVIVHYGAAAPTVAVANAGLDWAREVCVVANDGSSRPEGLHPDVRWLVPERNLGFGSGFMLGVRATESEVCVAMNNDIVLDASAAVRCVSLIEQPGVGVVGPVLRRPDGSLQSGGGTLSRLRRWPIARQDPGTQDGVATWVTGAIMFVRRSVLEVAPMDGSYFLGCEDVDFCLRAQRAGYTTVIAGSAQAVHHGGTVITGVRWNYYVYRNHVWFSRQHFGRLVAGLVWLGGVATLPRVLVADAVKRGNLLSSRLALHGLLDGLGAKPLPDAGPLDDEPRAARWVPWV